MAVPGLVELRSAQRDGTAQSERPRPELVPGSVGIDERTPADLISFARKFASHLLWYDSNNAPAGWWGNPEEEGSIAASPDDPERAGPTFFDGIGPGPNGGPGLGYADAAAFLDAPQAPAGGLYSALRRPHMALLLTAVGMMRHGQDALNTLTERHLDYQLKDVLRLHARGAEPDQAFVLFGLASGVSAAEAGAGLRLLAGRDERHRDRLYALDSSMIVNRAEVSRLASTFVDRELVGLAAARRAIIGTPEETYLFLLSLALGDPDPGDPLPKLAGKSVDLALLQAAAAFIAFSRAGLFLELFELRAMLARKALRAGEAADWQSINKVIEKAGRKKRGDAAWKLQTANPADFDGNLALALGGKPDLGGLTEVETVDDLALHLDRDDVRTAIETILFMDVETMFQPMIALKRAIDADWTIVNNYLELAGRRKRGQADWALKPKNQAAFADNLKSAIGAVKWSDAGPLGDAAVTDPDTYLSRIEDIEGWFFLSAEDCANVIAAFDQDETTPDGARNWREAYRLLGLAHSRKVRAQEAAALGDLRAHPPAGRTGPEAELEAALGENLPDRDSRMEALARFSPAEEVAFVRSVLSAPAGEASAADWARADSILAEARRRRLRLPEPEARKDHWRALFAYDDARSANSGEGTPWHCFGGIPADSGPAHLPAGIGFAIASPVLALSAGRRRIVLTLGFRADGGGPLIAPADDHGDSPAKIPFRVSLSGGKDWIEPQDCAFSAVDYRKTPSVEPVEAGMNLLGLQIALTLDETAPEIAPTAASSIFGQSPWPVVRLMLRPVWDDKARRFDTAYERFRSLKLERVNIACAVGSYALDGAPGLWPLDAETETGVANAKKPFEPFGPTPSLGSELALSHRDLLHKKLSKLSLSLEWLGGPSGIGTYYSNYPGRSAAAFLAQLSLVDGGVRTSLLNGTKALFAGEDSKLPVKIEVPAGDSTRPDPVVEPLEPEVRSWRRYLVVRLAGVDFGHHDYASLVTAKSIQLANDLRTPAAGGAPPAINPGTYAVNPPWTPKLKRIALDFTASEEVRIALYDRSSAVDRLFHVHPFGFEEARPGGVEGWPMLPDYAQEGALYIGLGGVEAPQSLSLLFAGTDGAGAEDRAGPVSWSYLDFDGWRDFPEPPEDGTDGLVKAGIVRFGLPAAGNNSLMPPGFYWLRAAMMTGAANACDMIDVHAQAAKVHFIDDGTDSSHYSAPLPPGTIKGFADPAPGIARVTQPYPASGGRPPEADAMFRIRAAERLRHKNRALSLWDYEHLVLERFDQVHKVKCLPASAFDDRPGEVRIVIIPDLHGKALGNAFAPRAPMRLLDEIADFLAPLAPSSATILPIHARFVEVRVRLGVRFAPGGDEGFNKSRLAQALNRFLAPWAFDEGSDIAIGQRIDATSIVAFVDSLPFVDFVGVCRLFASEDDGATFHLGEDDGDRVEARSDDQVLTPASRHEIDVIGDDLFEENEFTGIGYMKVELDFVVH